MKAKIYIGAKKYALYIGRKIVQKTLEFLTLPARFVSKKVQDLKNYIIYGNSVQDGIPTPTAPVEVESVGELNDIFDKNNVTISRLYQSNTATTGMVKNLVSASTLTGFIFDVRNVSGNITITREINVGAFRVFGTTEYPEIGVSSTSLAIENDKFTATFDVTDYNYLAVICTTDSIASIEEVLQGIKILQGYKIPVTVGGKNLFDRTLSNEIEGGYVEYPLSLEAGKTYTLSLEKNNCYNGGSPYSKQYVFVINKQGLTSNWTQSSLAYFGNTNTIKRANKATFTVPSEGASLYVYWGGSRTKPSDYLEILDIFFGNIQIELGDTATEYVPYIEPTTTNIYLDQPLRKIDDISDYIDFENKKVVRNIGENIVKGANVTDFSQGNYACRMTVNSIQENTRANVKIPFASNSFTWQGFSSGGGRPNMITSSAITTVRCWLWFENGLFTDTTTARAYIDTLNIIVYNVLATPTEEAIDLPAINIPQGTLTIDTTTNVKPSKIILTGDIDNE